MNSKHENAHNTPCAVEKNLISSFEACGIYPLNADRVLKRLPNDRSEEEVNREVNDSLVEFLKKKRFAETTTRVQRKKKRINVKPGKSVTFENSEESEEESHVDDPPEQTAFNSINEDDHSLHDNEEELLENIMCEIPTSDKLKIGAFILAKFLGGSRKKTEYRYACIIQDLYENELQVVSMKSGESKKQFKIVDKDISVIGKSDVVCILPTPSVSTTGERTKYNFPVFIDVKEY